ncbi:MAG: RIP metalloprotease RseP [Alphaproteobacteria bacterium]|nr:RIP metalloprotease RseP [Alphaproteobacteria bacterium]
MILAAWDILAHWVLPFLFVITAVVFFHELGHYSVARLFGVRVETFSLGFGREIVGRTDKHGTRWKIGWLPVGGYVKFFGDADAASQPDREAAETMTVAERKVSLQHKPLWQRSLVVAAGPFANFILAIAIFMLTLMLVGRVVIPPVIGTVAHGSPAEAAGIRTGDVVRDIEGTSIHEFGQLPEIVSTSAGQELAITLQRGERQYTVHVMPRNTNRTVLGSSETIPILGVTSSAKVKPAVVRYGPVEAFGESLSETWAIIAGTFKGFKQLILGRTDSRQLHGTVSIVVMTKNIAEFGFLALVQLIALLSVSIGLINLFPIPVLDGGHLLYYGCEAVLGRPLGERAQEVGFRFGLALVLGLMIFSFWNDLAHHLNLF